MSVELMERNSPEMTFTNPESIDGGNELADSIGGVVRSIETDGVPENLTYDDLIDTRKVEIEFGDKNDSIRIYRFNDRDEKVFVAGTSKSETDKIRVFDFNISLSVEKNCEILDKIAAEIKKRGSHESRA